MSGNLVMAGNTVQGDTNTVNTDASSTDTSLLDGATVETQEQEPVEEQSKDKSLLEEQSDESKQEQTKEVPDNYEIKAPEGFEFDNEIISEFKEMAKADGLSRDQAQKYVDLQIKALEKANQMQEKLVSDVRQQWREEVKRDPGHKDMLLMASKGLSQLGDEFAEFVKQNEWLGDNPKFLSGLAAVGKLVSEDGFVSGKEEPVPKSDWPAFEKMRQKAIGN